MMNKTLSKVVLTIVFSLVSLSANAFTASFLNAGYSASLFTTFESPTKTFAFDDSMNIYTSPSALVGSGSVVINKISVASSYTNSFTLFNYSTDAWAVTGLDFYNGQLVVSESFVLERSGKISYAGGNTIVSLPDFRPTGIDTKRDILFSARSQADPFWGNVYRLNNDSTLSTVISGLAARAITSNSGGDIFIATTNRGSGSFLGNSIYEFSAASSYSPTTAKLIATIGDGGVTQLQSDEIGNIYALYTQGSSSNGVDLIRISAVPEVETSAMLLTGLGLIGFMARRRKNTQA
jgi:hypothetical protein